MASQMEDRRGCFGRHYVSQPMCHREGENREGGGKRRRASSSAQQQQQQNRAGATAASPMTGHGADGRQLTGEWSRAFRSSLVRPAFPRLASLLSFDVPFFPRDVASLTAGRWTENAVRAITAPGYTRDIYVTSRFNAPRRLMSPTVVHCARPHADLSARKMFLIRGEKKRKIRARRIRHF